MNLLEKQLQDKGLPYSLEHEMAVNSILIASKAMLEALTEKGIDKSYFYTSMQQRIYLACCDIIDEGKDIDILMIKNRLKSEKNILETLSELEDYGILEFTWNAHIEGLIEYKQRREQVLKAIETFNSAYNGGFKVETQKNSNIKEYVLRTTGEFNINDVDRELHLKTKQEKNHRAVILNRLCKEEMIEKIGKRTGTYRLIIKDENVIDWKNANTDKAIDLKLIFDIQKKINIYPKNIIIIAGEKDAGKTAFLLNIVYDNMENHKIYYFSSEMVEMEMKSRLEKFSIPLDQWNFTPIERSGNFQDVIKPEDINIIDFLEISDNFYKIGEDIRRIYEKLTTGIAIIGIQKKAGTDFGRGAEFSMEKARLYLSLQAGEYNPGSKQYDNSTLKIVSAKNWKDPCYNPRGDIYTYTLYQGCQFNQTNIIKSPLEWSKEQKEKGYKEYY